MLHAHPLPRRHQPYKILIFESTCLIAALQTFNGSMRPVEALQEKGLYDRIVIPDIIFYELTAILCRWAQNVGLFLKMMPVLC